MIFSDGLLVGTWANIRLVRYLTITLDKLYFTKFPGIRWSVELFHSK